MGETADGVRVLVVDDEALIRWAIVERLAPHGYTALETDDAASTIEALSDGTAPPDVVFLDYRLPDSKDLGLLRRVRQLAPGAAIIMMTAFGTPDVFKEALDLGVYRVLHKPFDLAQLPELVESARRAMPH
jgi:DNA-binding NtrC family response regulator